MATSTKVSFWHIILLKRSQNVVSTCLSAALFTFLLCLLAARTAVVEVHHHNRKSASEAVSQEKGDLDFFKFPFCSCERKMARRGGEEEGKTGNKKKGKTGETLPLSSPLPSACNDYATARGPGQKVVSYSYYGDSQNKEVYAKYFSQIGIRAKEIAEKYPGWVMRLYFHNLEDDFEGLREMCSLFCQHPNLDFCDVDALPEPFGDLRGAQRIGKLWRFVVMMDPLVDVFISRDLDSAILDREVAAVREWLNSSRTFHIMRDHPSHNGFMLGGLWGARMRNKRAREDLARIGSEIVDLPPRDYWSFDQDVLRRLVWPVAKNDSLQHDSYTCNAAAFRAPDNSNGVPFPTRRKGGRYVGWGPPKGLANKNKIERCPESCRKRREWEYC